MASFNRATLVGNLTRDPELRYTPQGTAVTDLRLAVTTVRGGRDQERKEETLFIDVTVWGRTAENCSEYLSKGRPVLVDGRLQLDSWEDRETKQKRTKIKLVAQLVQFLGSRDGGPGGGGGGGASSQTSQASPKKADEEPLEQEFKSEDDIPF